MSDRVIRHGVAVVAVAAALLAAACSATTTPPVRIDESPSASPAVSSAAPAPEASASASKTTSKPPPAARKCLGAIELVVDARGDGPSSICMAVGGTVRVISLGPGMLEVDRREKLSCFYEAGMHLCRAISTGTVKFRINNEAWSRTITVTFTEAPKPPQPSPACMEAVPFTVNAQEEMNFFAYCVKVGSQMRLENVGPQGFTVSPADAVTCVREPTVSHCSFVKVATVAFRFSTRPANDILYVVSIA